MCNDKFQLDTTTASEDTIGRITSTYGENVNLTPADFKITSSYEDDSTKQLEDSEFVFTSNIPNAQITPAGTYVVTIQYSTLRAIKIEIVINKANIIIEPEWNYESAITYSGTEQYVEVVNVPENVNVIYTGVISAKNAGEYQTTARFYPKDPNNYTCSQTESLSWKIEKANLKIFANNSIITYGEQPTHAGYRVEGFVAGETENDLDGNINYSYDYVQFNRVGAYKITPSGFSSQNYNIEYFDGELTVNKAIIDLSSINDSNIKLKNNEFDYTGRQITVELESFDLPTGVQLSAVRNNKAKEIGSYTCVAIFECSDAVNYESFEPIKINMAWRIGALAYEKLIERIQKLEDLAKAYDSSNWQMNMLAYIRTVKYNTEEWSIVAGEFDSGFASYVSTNEGENKDVSNFRDDVGANENFKIPGTQETVDFYHLFAVMNVVHKGDQTGSDLSGWGGDLVQLMGQFKNSTETGETLLNSVRNAFNGSSYFGSADVCSDLDAVNIVNKYKNENYDSYVTCIEDYYAQITEQARINEFKANAFAGECTEDKVLSRLRNNIYIMGVHLGFIEKNGLADRYGVTIASDSAACMACIKVFVEYINS